MTVITVPSVVRDMPEAVYHADPTPGAWSLSSSMAKMLLPPSVPALARHKADHREHKDAWDLGSAVHALTLGTGCEVVSISAASWAGAAAKAARAEARARGAVALLERDFETASAMADKVMAHPYAGPMLRRPGAPEVSMFWREPIPDEDAETWCRARLDYWPYPTGVGPTAVGSPMTVDLKTTTADLDSRSLSREIAKYRYHIQEAFYRRAYYRCHGEWPVFVFVFVSTKPPYLVRCVELDDATRDAGACAVDKALTIWHACQMTGTWPGYDDVEMISLPPWELNQ